MKIALLEPYYGGSHKLWADGLKRHSNNQIEIFSLPDEFWKSRMETGAVALAKDFLQSDFQPDLLLASDMLNFNVFLSLTSKETTSLPKAVYFHENQITYPWVAKAAAGESPNRAYALTNFFSALAGDKVYFNSNFHKDIFAKALEELLNHLPGFDPRESIEEIVEKSRVLPVGLDFEALEAGKERGKQLKNQYTDNPIILWNHRWEYDKNPKLFFSCLRQVKEEGTKFKLVVLGDSSGGDSRVFDEAKDEFSDEIIQWGFTENHSEYAAWLWASDILPVTSNQDFFGISCAEAIYCETIPILPNRLAFPELLPENKHKDFLYKSEKELCTAIKHYSQAINAVFPSELSEHINKFSWKNLISDYDEEFEKLVSA